MALSHLVTQLSQRFRLDQLRLHSERVKPGDLFIALPGVGGHGIRYLDRALARGACAVFSDKPRPAGIDDRIEWFSTHSAGEEFVALAHTVAGDPLHGMPLIGVTGTNGKSTVAHGIYEMLNALGRTVGLFGTVAHRFSSRTWQATQTTPDLLSFLALCREMKDLGAQGAVLEVSSHALDQERLAGCRFNAAVFTNLTQDHLDYHQDMEAYFAAKATLFTKRCLENDAFSVINTDDAYGKRLAEMSEAKHRLTYALWDDRAHFRATELECDLSGCRAVVVAAPGRFHFRTPLIGRHNLYNLLAMVAVAHALGISVDRALACLETYQGLRGRLERVTPIDHPFSVFVDYAHSPDALHQVLTSLRPLVRVGGRLWVVFGCGGNRDRGKRPLMGREAAQFADRICLTSDNPRSEVPERIIDDILEGIPETARQRTHCQRDRREAIRECIAALCPGDLLLVAGKGHERYQLIGDQEIAFDDVEVAKGYLA